MNADPSLKRAKSVYDIEGDALKQLVEGVEAARRQQSSAGGAPDAAPVSKAYSGAGSLAHIAATVAACAAWTVVSSVAILVNKNILVDVGFKFPTTVASLGLVTTTLLSYVALQLTVPRAQQQSLTLRYYLTRILPTGFMMALAFQTGNSAYLYLTVAFVQMLKAFCPVVTMLLLFAVRLERATPRLVASVALISLGVATASYGEMNMSMVGLVTMLSSVVAEATRLVMTQYLLVGQSMHPFEGLVFIGSASSFWLVLLAILTEWDRILSSGAYLLVLAHPVKFLAAGLAGFGVNGLAIIVIKLASSLTLKVLGTVKDAALVTVSVVLFHEVVSLLQAGGYLLSLVGFVAYNIIKATEVRGTVAAGKAQ